MAKFILSIGGSLRPFAFTSAFVLLATAPGLAKPKSQCNQLTEQAACVALQVAGVQLCQWVAPESYTVSGQRKAYCRMSGKSITKAQYEAMQAAAQPSQ